MSECVWFCCLAIDIFLFASSPFSRSCNYNTRYQYVFNCVIDNSISFELRCLVGDSLVEKGSTRAKAKAKDCWSYSFNYDILSSLLCHCVVASPPLLLRIQETIRFIWSIRNDLQQQKSKIRKSVQSCCS